MVQHVETFLPDGKHDKNDERIGFSSFRKMTDEEKHYQIFQHSYDSSHTIKHPRSHTF